MRRAIIIISLIVIGYSFTSGLMAALPEGAVARIGKGIITQIKFSPDGKYLAVSTSIGVWLYDAKTYQEVKFLESDGHLTSISFSPDGNLIASGSVDRTIKLWEVKSGNLIRTLTGRTDWVRSVSFSPDGSLLASGSKDNTIKLWEVSSGNLIRTLTGHTGYVGSVSFSPDGSLLASGSWNLYGAIWAVDAAINLWEVKSGNLIRTLTGHTDGVNSVSFSPDGSLLASGSGDGTVILWDMKPYIK